MEQVQVLARLSNASDNSARVKAFSVVLSQKSFPSLVLGSFWLVIYSASHAPAAIRGRGPLMVVSM